MNGNFTCRYGRYSGCGIVNIIHSRTLVSYRINKLVFRPAGFVKEFHFFPVFHFIFQGTAVGDFLFGGIIHTAVRRKRKVALFAGNDFYTQVAAGLVKVNIIHGLRRYLACADIKRIRITADSACGNQVKLFSGNQRTAVPVYDIARRR